MHRRDQKRLAKLVFAILARNPFEYGIIPDEQGWVKVKELHRALMKGDAFRSLSVHGLLQFFELFKPERMEVSGKMVRVLPEFHLPGLLDYPAVMPPARLYLPVRRRAHAHVLRRGMNPYGDDEWIVLWPTRQQAEDAARFRDRDPLVAAVDMLKADRQGCVVFSAGDGTIYLVHRIESEWLDLPPLPESEESAEPAEVVKKRAAKGKKEMEPELPGSFIPDAPPIWYDKSYGKGGRRRDRRKQGGRRRRR